MVRRAATIGHSEGEPGDQRRSPWDPRARISDPRGPADWPGREGPPVRPFSPYCAPGIRHRAPWHRTRTFTGIAGPFMYRPLSPRVMRLADGPLVGPTRAGDTEPHPPGMVDGTVQRPPRALAAQPYIGLGLTRAARAAGALLCDCYRPWHEGGFTRSLTPGDRVVSSLTHSARSASHL